MNTDDLVSMLSTGVEPVDPKAIAKRFSLAMLIGGVVALLVILLRFGVRPDLAEVAAARDARRSRVLLRSTHVVGKVEIRRDAIELAGRLILFGPTAAAVKGNV